MIKLHWATEEWWPVYTLTQPDPDDTRHDDTVAVPAELWQRYQTAEREWDAVQGALARLLGDEPA